MAFNFDVGATFVANGAQYPLINCTLNRNTQKTTARASGRVNPDFSVVVGEEISFECESYAVEQLLDLTTSAISLSGTPVVWGEIMDSFGVRSTNFRKYALSNALIVPGSLQASQGGIASISFGIHTASTDGHTSPLTITESNAAGNPTISAFSAPLTLGTVELNGTLLEGITNVSISFGQEVIKTKSDGDFWNRYCSVLSQAPTITLTTVNPGQAYSLIGRGLALNPATGLVINLRSFSNAVLGNETVSISVAAGTCSVGGRNLSNSSAGTTTIEVSVTKDDNNSPFVIA